MISPSYHPIDTDPLVNESLPFKGSVLYHVTEVCQGEAANSSMGRVVMSDDVSSWFFDSPLVPSRDKIQLFLNEDLTGLTSVRFA